MTTINTPTPLEIARLSEQDGKRYELHRGQLVEKTKMSIRSNYIATVIAHHLMSAYPPSKAYTIVEQPTYCFDDPTDMRIPDVVLVWANRLPEGLDDGELHVTPDLVVEVVSPTNKYDEVHERVEEFRSSGVPLIWVVGPAQRDVYVHRADGSVARYWHTDTIKDEPLLPGLVVSVAAFFPGVPTGA